MAMDATIRGPKTMTVCTDGIGFYIADDSFNYVHVFFENHDPAKGLAMLDQLRDELQAVVLDKLIEEGGQ